MTGFLNNIVETDTTILFKYVHGKQQLNAVELLVDVQQQKFSDTKLHTMLILINAKLFTYLREFSTLS